MGEEAGDGFVDLGELDRLGVEDLLDGQVQAAISREQRPDPQKTVLRRGVVVYEGSSDSETADPTLSRIPIAGLITCQVHIPLSRRPCLANDTTRHAYCWPSGQL